jgi:hypothetical protein
MKKPILLSLIASFSLLMCHKQAVSQYLPEPFNPDLHVIEPMLKTVDTHSNIIWHEDFAGGLPGSWGNVNESGYCAFNYTKTGPRGPLSLGVPALKSETSSNGFMILDTDACNVLNPDGLADAYLETPAIDLSLHPNVLLRFQHNFRFCCTAEGTKIQVEVSNDYQNWVAFDVKNNVKPNNISANPFNQNINISAVAGGQGQVWIRFRKSGASHYWWMIDDVKLVSFIENDLKISAVEFNNGYTQIPGGQQQPFSFKAKIRNEGGLPQTQIVLDASVNQFLYKSSSVALTSLAAGQETTIALQPEFTLPGKGIYNVVMNVTQNETDETPSNNTLSSKLYVTDSVYSRTRFDEVFIEDPTSANGSANLFHIYKSIEATSISFALHENSQVGEKLQIKLYQIVNNVHQEIASSDDFQITQDILSGEGLRWVSLPFTASAILSPGDYLAAVVAESNKVKMVVQAPVAQPSNSSFSWVDQQWQPTIYTPAINLNFGNNTAACTPIFHFAKEETDCGGATGSIQVYPLTGVGPYAYIWETDSANNTSFAGELASGTYKVTITDGYGCEAETEVVVENKSLLMEYQSFAARCGLQGVLEIQVLNGTAPYSYSWSHSNITTAVAENLTPGLYTVIVTDSTLCKGEIVAEVENIDELLVDMSVSDAFCGSANGKIQLIPLSGVEPFIFTWDQAPGVKGASYNNLLPGNYSFSVVDSENCAFTGSAVIEDVQYSLEMYSVLQNATCNSNNGMATVNITNGQAPFTYNWSNGIKVSAIINAAPGVYTVNVADHNGCRGSRSLTIQNVGNMPKFSWQTTNTSGCGLNNGEFIVNPENSSFVYSYQVISDDNHLAQTANSFKVDNLAAGTYLLKVVNDLVCEKIVAIDISDNNGPTINTTPDDIKNISCFGRSDGSISVKVENGGTNPKYLWNDDQKSTGTKLENLTAGIYTIRVNNDEGCKSVASFEIKEPAMLLANAVIEQPICNQTKGSIQLTVTGGSNPVTYIWNTGATSRNISNLQPGNFNVRITDYSYCTFENTYTILDKDVYIDYTVVHEDEDNGNGSIRITARGGDGNYSFLWNTGDDGEEITGLSAGVYTVTVVDGSGCEKQQSIVIGTVDVPVYEFAENLKLFPNPVHNNLQISFTNTGNGLLILEVFSTLGEKVYSEIRLSNPGELIQLDLNTQSLNPGVYFLRIRSGDHFRQSRFVKQ